MSLFAVVGGGGVCLGESHGRDRTVPQRAAHRTGQTEFHQKTVPQSTCFLTTYNFLGESALWSHVCVVVVVVVVMEDPPPGWLPPPLAGRPPPWLAGRPPPTTTPPT